MTLLTLQIYKKSIGTWSITIDVKKLCILLVVPSLASPCYFCRMFFILF